MYFDTHAHYYDDAFDADRDEVLSALPAAWKAMLDFAARCRECVPHVIMTIVNKDKTPEEIERCRRLTMDLGVTLRVRTYIPD